MKRFFLILILVALPACDSSAIGYEKVGWCDQYTECQYDYCYQKMAGSTEFSLEIAEKKYYECLEQSDEVFYIIGQDIVDEDRVIDCTLNELKPDDQQEGASNMGFYLCLTEK